MQQLIFSHLTLSAIGSLFVILTAFVLKKIADDLYKFVKEWLSIKAGSWWTRYRYIRALRSLATITHLRGNPYGLMLYAIPRIIITAITILGLEGVSISLQFALSTPWVRSGLLPIDRVWIRVAVKCCVVLMIVYIGSGLFNLKRTIDLLRAGRAGVDAKVRLARKYGVKMGLSERELTAMLQVPLEGRMQGMEMPTQESDLNSLNTKLHDQAPLPPHQGK